MWMDGQWHLFLLFNRSKIMIRVRILLFECLMKKSIWKQVLFIKKERNKGRKKEIRRNVYHIRKTPNEVQNLFQVEVKGALIDKWGNCL